RQSINNSIPITTLFPYTTLFRSREISSHRGPLLWARRRGIGDTSMCWGHRNREELAQRRRWHASPSRWAGSARWAFTRARSRRSSPRRQDPHQEVLGGGAEVPAAEARA